MYAAIKKVQRTPPLKDKDGVLWRSRPAVRTCDSPSPAIRAEVRAWVMEDLMAMVNEEGGGCHQQPPISIMGRSGVVDVTNGSWGAWKGHNPQNHGGGCSGNHHCVVSRKVHGVGNAR